MKQSKKHPYNFVSAVLYIHNAEERIETFLRTILDVLEEHFEYAEIICVNDASEDNSLAVIRQLKNVSEKISISVIHLSYFHGLEAAMNAGMDFAIGDFVFEFDNTILDFAKEDILAVYRRALLGCDIVSASPVKKEKFTSRLFYRIFDQFAEVPCQMKTESFRILSRRAVNRVKSVNNAVLYRKAVYANIGLITERIYYESRKSGMRNAEDKKEKSYRRGLAVDSLLLFTRVGYRFSMMMMFLMMFLSFFMVAYSLLIYLTKHPIEGWTTTILFLSVVFFGLFGILTLIVKYLQILVNLVFKRKQYSFETIEKL